METNDTKQKILTIAQQEFMENGFEKASLRRIARMADLSTGAIYGYFKDKQDLFSQLVREPAETLYQEALQFGEEFFAQNPQLQFMGMGSSENRQRAEKLLVYMYDHFDVFKLIVLQGKDTAYEDYFDRLAKLEEENTYRFLANMKKEGLLVYEPEPPLIHIICDLMIKSLAALIEHDIPREKGFLYWEKMAQFYSAAWQRLLFSE